MSEEKKKKKAPLRILRGPLLNVLACLMAGAVADKFFDLIFPVVHHPRSGVRKNTPRTPRGCLDRGQNVQHWSPSSLLYCE